MNKGEDIIQGVQREFQWLPEELVSTWFVGIKAYHEKHGWGPVYGILWDKDTMVFVGMSPSLFQLLNRATKSWLPNKKHLYQTFLLSVLLSVESLGSDFAGWGTKCPEAKHKADQILETYFDKNRYRLLDIYMPLRSQLDSNAIKAFGPH